MNEVTFEKCSIIQLESSGEAPLTTVKVVTIVATIPRESMLSSLILRDGSFFIYLERKIILVLYISGILIGMSLVLELGTGNLGLIRTGITKGFLPAFIFSLGCAVGDMVYAVLSVFGISLLLQLSSVFQIILWVGGTIMLISLTYQAFKDFFYPKPINLEVAGIQKMSLWEYFFTGIWLVVSAPTALVWFTTVGGSVVSSTIGNSSNQGLIPFFLGFVTVSIVWGAILAYLSSIGGKMMGTKMLRIFSLVSGLLFLYFTFYVFISGVKNVL